LGTAAMMIVSTQLQRRAKNTSAGELVDEHGQRET
jgi:hypothetical protein